MKKLIAIPLLALAAGCAPSEPIALSNAEQSQLAKELHGLTAGPTVSCVNMGDLRGNRSVGEGVILFDGPAGTVYVNRPAAGCPALGSSRALITKTAGTQLCRGDIANVVDPGAGFSYGGCTLGDFTPYRRKP